MTRTLAAVLLASVLTLCSRPLIAGSKDVTPNATRFATTYNASWTHAFKYFLRYRKKYGAALRMRSMLEACNMTALAQQVDSDLPNVALFAGKQLQSDRDATASMRNEETLLSVTLATQSLVTGYELGYLEAFKGEAHQSCGFVGKVYDNYLKNRAK